MEHTIRNIFRLSDGSTVIACDGRAGEIDWSGRKARIVSDDRVLQDVEIKGERIMTRQSAHLDQLAIDTVNRVELSLEEAQSGKWRIST